MIFFSILIIFLFNTTVQWILFFTSVFVPLCFHKGHLWLYLLNNHDKNGWYNGRTLKLGRLILYTVAFRLLVTYVMICHEFIQSNQFDSSKRVSIGQIKFFVYTGKKKVFIDLPLYHPFLSWLLSKYSQRCPLWKHNGTKT
jgi:hypothetical protein